MFEQKERTYQRPSLGCHKIGDENKKAFRENPRKFKGIGMNYQVPKEGIVGANFIDKKCPFTGNVSIRGKILRGEVKTAKMQRTIVVRMNYLQYIKKYKRYEKRHKNISAHCSPAFHVKEGDVVEIGECRPLSKTVKFNVINITRKGNGVFTNKAI